MTAAKGSVRASVKFLLDMCNLCLREEFHTALMDLSMYMHTFHTGL